MRPLRFLLTLITCITAFFLLLFGGPWTSTPDADIDNRSRLRTYFDWRTPSSLFPPSAIISLTDDNTTFFLARPAGFGPLLPVHSLSGQLWIGDGFGDEHFGSSYPQGELGCSDVPGWDGGSRSSKSGDGTRRTGNGQRERVRSRRQVDEGHVATHDTEEGEDAAIAPDEADGTDDHLHHPLPPSDDPKSMTTAQGGLGKTLHADIQSLQESAEISGKIVLLSRGGCGFLEKVKWVQRRGGIALIVGDNVRGRALVTMYARGDTSNITIPSLFTSQTTAHLLTSLVPSGQKQHAISESDAERLGLTLPDDSQAYYETVDEPNFTTSAPATKNTKITTLQKTDRNSLKASLADDYDDYSEREKGGWFGGFFGGKRPSGSDDRPQRVGWLQEEFDETKSGESGPNDHSQPHENSGQIGEPTGDGFVIGVQDWRDPDLVAEQREQLLASPPRSSTVPVTPQSSQRPELQGGSITPGSGEYVEATDKTTSSANLLSSGDQRDGESPESGRWLGRIFRSGQNGDDSATQDRLSSTSPNSKQAYSATRHGTGDDTQIPAVREGLWVTLTPTSMSSSPFFDTLLVLVVSPLVTLTVVYALLLLRSRIRRRRWRAPKSVIERLPVRTYQTISSPSSTSSSFSSPATATTPLLPSNAPSISARPRPRSRTTSEVPVLANQSLRSESMASPSLDQIEEKRAAGLAEWRRRYGGKQRECVVCLEEYIDGVSRVMSLPCGHEFHAECITPWLTTRRRTCPICKGDVVRSLARASTSVNTLSPLREEVDDYSDNSDNHNDDDDDDDDDDDVDADHTATDSEPLVDVQEEATGACDEERAATNRGQQMEDSFDDLERGISPDRTR